MSSLSSDCIYFSWTMWGENVHWIFHCFVSAQEKHFINDTIRSEFHRKFMDKYVRWRKALSTDLPPSIMHYTQNCNILLCSFILVKSYPPTLNTCRWRHMVMGLHSPATPPYISLPRCCGISFGVATIHSDIAFGRSDYFHPGTWSTYQHYSLAHSAYCLVPKPPTVRSHPTHKTQTMGRPENKATLQQLWCESTRTHCSVY